ncbi:unnamed protein product [Chironomus riparius]|uniref:F-box domain-containing protein n=1 Tax=Chironomus riparius TaxID=315576 RepID=A0A9P0JDC1_9DIPT|nr:unnamed protein product [Chironomus riparius]
MKRLKDKAKNQHQVACQKTPNKFKTLPIDVLLYIFNFLTCPEDRMSLISTSRRTLTTFFDEIGIMRKMTTTFYKNDKVRRNFIRNYGRKLRNIEVKIDRRVIKFLKMMLPKIPNVEQLSLDVSEIDVKNYVKIQLRKRSISLPFLNKVEVFKPVDLKVITSFIEDSIKCVKYSTEICNLIDITEYLKNVQSFECGYPIAILPPNATPDLLTFNSITSIKISNVHCGSLKDLNLPNIKFIEIDKLGWTDFYLRGFFNSISNVEHFKINAISSSLDIPDIIGEVVRLPSLKTFSLQHIHKFSIYINVEEHKIVLSDYIRDNCEPILKALQSGYEWYQGE